MIGIYQDSFKQYLEDNLGKVKTSSRILLFPVRGVNTNKIKIIIIYI